MSKKSMAFGQAIAQAMREEMQKDRNIIIIGEDVASMGGAFGVTACFVNEFGPERIIDMPIAEAGIGAMAIGASQLGVKTIADMMFTDFATLTFDQIVNTAAKMWHFTNTSCPVVFRMPNGGGLGAGAAHSQMGISWFYNVPGLKIVMPSTPADAKGLMKAAIRDADPVLFFEHKALYGTQGEVPDEDYVIELGVANVMREGQDVTIISAQAMVHKAMQAAEQLAKQGISAEVVDIRCLVPFDRETVIKSVKKTKRAIIAHEDSIRGGWGGEVAAIINKECFGILKSPVERVGAPNVILPFGMPEFSYQPSADMIITAINGMFA